MEDSIETHDTDISQSGGKLLGHGVYGCAFMPPLLCRGETRHRNKT